MSTQTRYRDRLIELLAKNNYAGIETLISFYRSLLDDNSPVPISSKGHTTLEEVISDEIFHRREMVYCGKNCKKCPHGPYWYAYLKTSTSQLVYYIGKDFRQVTKSAILTQLNDQRELKNRQNDLMLFSEP